MEFTKITIDMLKATQMGNMYLPVLTDAIIGLIESGGARILPHPYAVNGIYYSNKENLIYIDPKFILTSSTIGQAKEYLLRALKGEEDAVKFLEESLAKMIAGVSYFSMYVLGKEQPSLFINIEETKQWYRDFFYASIFRLSDGRVASGLLGIDDPIPPLFENQSSLIEGRTYLSRYTSDFWARRYLLMMPETFELPIYNGSVFTSSDYKKVYAQLAALHAECMESLKKSDIYDDESLQGYDDWFQIFSKEYKTFFLNQYKRIRLTRNLFFAGNFHAVDLDILAEAYQHVAVAADVNKLRFPAPICRELFMSNEPIAQATNALILSGRIRSYPQYQKLAAQGLSYMGQ